MDDNLNIACFFFFQVAEIVRNLSFEEENVPVLARNLTCVRFCLLCCSSKWSDLNQNGFDILSNIASEIALQAAGQGENCVTDVLLSTLTTQVIILFYIYRAYHLIVGICWVGFYFAKLPTCFCNISIYPVPGRSL